MINIARIGPGHEQRIRHAFVPEDLGPTSAGPPSIGFPRGAQFRVKCRAMRGQIGHQFHRDRPGKSGFGVGRVVARFRNDADLIFHLHHQHRLARAIHGLQMPHQLRKGTRVGIASCGGQSGNAFRPASIGSLHARKPLRVALHP